jgi:DNA (cytosine-5)-methyltransferase 1
LTTIGSLFAGIGGLELGLERALGDARVVWQVEIDPLCRRILERHWPHAQRHIDILDVGAHNLARVDVVCGGFPCQDISVAGQGRGLEGARSSLWTQMARVVGELRPVVVVVENVPALLARGLGRVLGDLAALGYDAEWDVHSAAAVGAPHLRERLFIVAADANRHVVRIESERNQRQGRRERAAERQHTVAVDAGTAGSTANADMQSLDVAALARRDVSEPSWACANERGWAPASAICGVDDGLFPGMERAKRPTALEERRLKTLGNAVVPQVAEVVGRRVAELLRR